MAAWHKQRIKLFKDLTEAGGVPGYEKEIRGILKEHLKEVGEVEQDNLGSIIFKKQGQSQSPRVMLPAHMDEIGFMVRLVTDDGFVRFIPLGGWWHQVLMGQRVVIKGKKGDVPGVIGSKPPHILKEEERKQAVKMEDMFIDVGASGKKEVEESFGIRPGNPIIPLSPFTVMKNGKTYLAKAWDDRVGCALMVDILKKLVSVDHPNTVYGVGTVQEEVGTRGAKTAAEVVNPDVAIVLEVGIAGDVPGIKPEEAQGSLGKGPQVCLYDSGMIPNLKLRDLIIETAEKKKIPYQFTVLERGATDGRPIHVHARGVPCVYLGIPTRHIHSHAGIIHQDDYENGLRLILEVIQKLDKKTVKDLI